MSRAFIHIYVGDGTDTVVQQRIRQLINDDVSGVRLISSDVVAGVSGSLIVIVEADSPKEIGDFVIQKVQQLPGVVETKTSLSLSYQ